MKSTGFDVRQGRLSLTASRLAPCALSAAGWDPSRCAFSNKGYLGLADILVVALDSFTTQRFASRLRAEDLELGDSKVRPCCGKWANTKCAFVVFPPAFERRSTL